VRHLHIENTGHLTYQSSLIDEQFQRLGSNITRYGSYDSQQLNDSAAVINSTIASHNPIAPGYLFVTLTAFNATGADKYSNSNGSVNAASPGDNGSTTGLAMSVMMNNVISTNLYSIQDHTIRYYWMRVCLVHYCYHLRGMCLLARLCQTELTLQR
jgi:hypothetical protein